jgi:ribosome-binding factor A
MSSRRQEKMARVVKEAVSDAILKHLSDPRIQGLVSVTRVDMPPDLKTADVYISVLIGDTKKEDAAFEAVANAANYLKQFVAKKVVARFCPRLVFHKDDTIRRTMETMRLINQVSDELEKNDNQDTED